jgi:DNA repair exonuclease SbcCD nuclease subunit
MDLSENQAKQTSTFLIDTESIEAAGFDFALLGHQHTVCLWPEEAPRFIYPGSPELLTLEQSGEANYVALLTIDEETCTPELIPVGQWRYLSLEVDLTGCDSTEAAVKRTQQSLQATENSNEERSICYVTFSGKPNFDLDIEALYDRVETKAYIHYKTDLSMTYDLKQLVQEPTTRGLLVRNFQSRLENSSSEQERRFALTALDLALRSLEGRKIQFNEIK